MMFWLCALGYFAIGMVITPICCYYKGKNNYALEFKDGDGIKMAIAWPLVLLDHTLSAIDKIPLFFYAQGYNKFLDKKYEKLLKQEKKGKK